MTDEAKGLSAAKETFDPAEFRHELAVAASNLQVDSVTSALKRARASLQRRVPSAGELEPPPDSDSPSEDAIVAKFVRAWESADLDALVALLDGRRLRLDATDFSRIREPRRRGPLLRQHLPLGPEVRPRADASQRSAGVRGLPAPRPASASGSASTSSPSPAIGSAP